MSADALASADRLAHRLVAAMPQSFGVARTPGERETVFRLRYRAVVDMGWATPEDLPDGLERDEDDDRSVHVCAHEGDELVGTARVVLPQEDRPLPLERSFDLELGPLDAVEIGRLVITPRLRGDASHGLLVALFAQCWRQMRRRGFTELVTAVPPRLLELYRSLGFTVLELGPSREHWGEERFPVRFDVVGSAHELTRALESAGSHTAPAR